MGDVAAQDTGSHDAENVDGKSAPPRQDRISALNHSALLRSSLCVGLALVYLSFDRAKAITRTAAMTFIDRVAEHGGAVDGQFKEVQSAPGGAEATSVRRKAQRSRTISPSMQSWRASFANTNSSTMFTSGRLTTELLSSFIAFDRAGAPAVSGAKLRRPATAGLSG